jgi:hypothetical protein
MLTVTTSARNMYFGLINKANGCCRQVQHYKFGSGRGTLSAIFTTIHRTYFCGCSIRYFGQFRYVSWSALVLCKLTLLQSLDMLYASQKHFYFIKINFCASYAFYSYYIFSLLLLRKFLEPNGHLYHENGFWCSCQFYWTHLITNIETVPCIG